MKPVVSVILSVYNGQGYLKNTVESVLNQSFKDFEFVIVNDGSTDETDKILKSFHDPRLRIYHQENCGLTKSLNKAISLSKGQFIARIDADEVAAPERFSKQVNFLRSNPNVGIVGSFCFNHNDIKQSLERIILPVSDEDIRRKLMKNNPLVHGSVMIRREVFDRVGYYNENFKYSQDYELWSRIAMSYKMHNLPEFLLTRYITSNSLSSDTRIMKTQAYLAVKIQLTALRNLSAPVFCYFFLLPSISLFLLHYLKIAKFVHGSKEICQKIFGRN